MLSRRPRLGAQLFSVLSHLPLEASLGHHLRVTVVQDVPCKEAAAAARPGHKAPGLSLHPIEGLGKGAPAPRPRLPVSLISDWPIHFVPVPMATTSFTAEGGKGRSRDGGKSRPPPPASSRAPAPPPPTPACRSSPCRGPHREAPRRLPLAPPAAPPPAQSTRACRGPASPASAAALHNGGSREPPLGRRPTWLRAEGERNGTGSGFSVPAGTRDGMKVPPKQEDRSQRLVPGTRP